MIYPGRFITFEGIDGSGKSTQTKLLAARLQDEGYDIILTREPGGPEGAEEIRDLVLQGATDRWSAETEILLFTAARRDHIERTILPALIQGKIVICDRFAYHRLSAASTLSCAVRNYRGAQIAYYQVPYSIFPA